jgi:SAM-dependent methyltransferase
MTAEPAVRPAAPIHRVRRTCRGCDAGTLERVLELGQQPLANAFLRSPDEFATELRFPLDVYLCTGCGLVQLLDVIDPEVLFRDYIYVTGTSRTIAEHNRRYAATVTEELGLGPDSLVVEVASNDGSLLEQFRRHGVRTLGVEPARNVAAVAQARGLETVTEFFGEQIAPSLLAAHGPASVVIGNNVLAHVDDTQGFLRAARSLLVPGGRVIVEVPYLEELVDRLEYDTVYHEHLCYFSVTALLALCRQAGLTVVRVDRVPVHGGSIRVWAARNDEQAAPPRAVRDFVAHEDVRGLTSLGRFRRLAADVRFQREALNRLLEQRLGAGRRVAAYGAPAKGNTLLNYCGITPDVVAFTVDRNPMKVGLYTPGTHLPVRAYETLASDPPDDLLILAWNFADEIMRQDQERAFHERGGRFILPIPAPSVH